MPSTRFQFHSLSLISLCWLACSSNDPATPGSSAGSGSTSTTSTSTATAGGTTATVTATSATSSGAASTSTGVTQTSATVTSTTGTVVTSTASTTSTTTGGAGGSTGATLDSTTSASTTGGTTLTGGASAAFVCTPGATYGDPLAGMGNVQSIVAPQGSYFAFIEGPVWVGSLGTLFFSDNASSPQERIWKLVPPSTTPEIFLEPSGSNGLAIDNDDQLVLADQRNLQITRVNSATGALIDTLAGPGSFKPNDLIYRSDGNVYFTDPDTGFYRISPEGVLSGPVTEVSRPNGTVLSLDENTLYVGDVNNRQIHAFQLGGDGAVGAGSLFVTAVNNTVDGMAVDCAGNLYAGTANGVEVFSSAGAPLGTVPTGESSNATFGGADRKTLYVTSRSELKSVTLAVPGLPD